MSISSPIVILDSGLGGLTVARAIREALPREELLYFGDTARVPYGGKTASTVTRFVGEIIGYFRNRQPKHVVIACNTATALALPAVVESFPELSISGVIEPGVCAALEAVQGKIWPTIGIIATDATIRSESYVRAIQARRSDVHLHARATPLLVPIIEEGRQGDDPLVRLALEQYLAPMLEARVDALVLGCTHYPILKEVIAREIAPAVTIDSAAHCAQDVARRLAERGLLRDEGAGSLQCFVSDDPLRFSMLASRIVGFELAPATWVSLDELHEDRRPVASPSVSVDVRPVAVPVGSRV